MPNRARSNDPTNLSSSSSERVVKRSSLYKTSRSIATLAGTLLKVGYFLTIPEHDTHARLVESAGEELERMGRWCTNPSAEVNSPDHLAAETACRRLIQSRDLAFGLFLSPDAGTDAVLRTVSEPMLAFFSVEPSALSVDQLAEKLLSSFYCDEEVVVAALIYLSRLIRTAKIPFTARSAHRLLAAAMLLAIKTHDDFVLSLQEYARICNTTTKALAALEVTALDALGWSTYIAPVDYLLMTYSLRSCHSQTSLFVDGTEVEWGSVLRILRVPPTASFLGIAPRVRSPIDRVSVRRQPARRIVAETSLDEGSDGPPLCSASSVGCRSVTQSVNSHASLPSPQITLHKGIVGRMDDNNIDGNGANESDEEGLGDAAIALQLSFTSATAAVAPSTRQDAPVRASTISFTSPTGLAVPITTASNNRNSNNRNSNNRNSNNRNSNNQPGDSGVPSMAPRRGSIEAQMSLPSVSAVSSCGITQSSNDFSSLKETASAASSSAM